MSNIVWLLHTGNNDLHYRQWR